MAAAGVPIDILTGFLGSGKTTLLRHILEHGLDGRRVAVIMNEIGDIGIDGRTIEGLNVEQMIELGSGCVCCTVNREFGLALQEIIETVAPDMIIVETTGVADPPNIVYETRQIGLGIDAIVTVVDAENLETHLAASDAAREQIAAADFVVLNKCDLVDAAAADAAERRVRGLNSRALVVRTDHGRIDHTAVFAAALHSPAEPAERHEHHHLERDGITAFTHETSGTFDKITFEQLLGELPPTVYRAKGIVRFSESDWCCLFNYTCGRWVLEWREPAGEKFLSQSVLIGTADREPILGRL
ncbi:MAG TPA: GTP-binding protein, partial [Blastocatellia bacterium]|nr:GTP-binding protein [Blastocatellia bacterium]